MTAFEKSLRLSPLEPQWNAGPKFGMASALCWGGRPEEALPWVRRALQERPDWAGIHRLLVAALWLSGRHAEAKVAARRYLEMVPGFSVSHARKVSPVRGTPGQERYFDAPRESACRNDGWRFVTERRGHLSSPSPCGAVNSATGGGAPSYGAEGS